MANIPVFEEPKAPPIEYYKVPVSLFRVNELTDADLYFYYQGQYLLFKQAKTAWSVNDDQKVESSHIDTLFVKFKSHKEHNDYLQDKLTKFLERRDVSLKQKAGMLAQTAEPILTSIYSTPESSELISSAADYTKNCIKFLNDKGSVPELIRLSANSFAEHAHGLHVSAYAVALAKRAGFVDPHVMLSIGMGALLHDIGKSKLPKDIVNKAGPLTDPEWRLMRTHPELGEKVLDHRQAVPLVTRQIVLEHHERTNGKGYPRGIKGPHSFSRIVTIADVFHSLVSDRPWARGRSPFEALKYMIETQREELDLPLLEKFIEMLSK